jgi:tetratricopeptide (TPR) repeat protein
MVLTITLLLILGTILMYNPALHGDFVNYDDPDYVTNNPHILHGLSRTSIRWAFSAVSLGHWHPITLLSHMADVELFKLNPRGHHLTSVVIHAINAVLIFLLLLSTTGQLWRCAMVAGLFALHPLNVESVAWISERNNLLCTLFMLLAFWAYKRYRERKNVARYLQVVLFFALGLMAKSMVVTLPFLLLLFDYWPLQRNVTSRFPEQSRWPAVRKFRMLATDKIVLFTMAAATAVFTYYTHRAAANVNTTLPLRFRLENTVYSYFLYLVKGFWPVPLSLLHPLEPLALWKVIGAFGVLLAITLAVVRYRQRRYLVFGWFWYLGAMFPVAGIIQAGHAAMADRYTYIPFLGIFSLVVWLTADLMNGVKIPRFVMPSIAVIVLALLASLGYRQAGYWNNSIALFSHELKVKATSEAETNLGAAWISAGRPELALPHFVAAVHLDPASANPRFWMADALQRQGRLAEAEREYQNALRYAAEPETQAEIYNNLSLLFLATKDLSRAHHATDQAIRLNARQPNLFLLRGSIEYQEGNLNAARDDYSRAAQISPSPNALYWLGRILEQQKHPKEASNAYRAALQLAPGMTEARSRLDAISATQTDKVIQ